MHGIGNKLNETYYTNYHLCVCKIRPFGSKPLEPAETRLRFNFPESRVAFPRYNPLIKTGETFLQRNSSSTRPNTYQHHSEITQSHTFAALIRLSTTTHNLLTFNTSQISSNDSEELSLLADTHLWTFLLHSSYSSSRIESHGNRSGFCLIFQCHIVACHHSTAGFQCHAIQNRSMKIKI